MSGTTRALRWRSVPTGGANETDLGLEHLVLKVAETGIAAEAVVVGGSALDPHGLRWRFTVDPDWACFRSLHLTLLGGATVALRHDGYGEWSDGEGKRRKEFAGLSDCLVEGSPFGVTALLKRLGKKADKTQTIDVVAVTVPSLEVARVSVTLSAMEPGRRYRLARGEAVEEIEVDADGLVTRWGDRLARIDAGAPVPEALAVVEG